MSAQSSNNKDPCSSARFSAAEFFQDCPWLNVPQERRGEILLEPLYPRGRLCGGSSSQSTGKPSKLATLAAARRNKENEKTVESDSNSSVALLDRLRRKVPSSAPNTVAIASREELPLPTVASPSSSSPAARKYTTRRHRSADKGKSENSKSELEIPKPTEADPEQSSKLSAIPAALPSAFAQTMFGMPVATNREIGHASPHKDPLHRSHVLDYALPHHSMKDTESIAFTGPSPDDVVLKAQSSKGPARGAKKD